MKPCNVKEMLSNSSEDPCFFVDFHNIGRGLIGDSVNNENETYIKATKTLNRWRIVGDKLEKVPEKNYAILFDAETYIFQWTFEYVENGTIQEDTLFYYWKGNNAAKGFSPLPPEIESQNPAVERICQWSEPALFFHMFSTYLVVFNGTQEQFDPSAKRLFIVRGELSSEIHLYEIPCLRQNLRSRGVFLLLNPSKNTIYFWVGSAVPKEHQQLLKNHVKLEERNEHWTDFKQVEVKDGHEDQSFLDLLEHETGDYVKLPSILDFTPRLFYFNSITGEFLATEVEYPLRSKKHKSAFPFLQSHLYTADQPALFLLDNDKEVWLWEGWKTPESNLEIFKIELRLAKETADNYTKEKCPGVSIPIKHVRAGLEPLEFINIFPYWSKRNDITEIQLKR